VDKKISPELRDFLNAAEFLPARLIQQLEAERRKAESKRKRRGKPPKRQSKPWQAHSDLMADWAALEEVFKQPPRRASRTIAELSGKGAFKGKSKKGLLSRHNRPLKKLRERNLEEPIRNAIRDHGAALYIGRAEDGLNVRRAAEASANVRDWKDKVEGLSPAEKKQLEEVFYVAVVSHMGRRHGLGHARILFEWG
jgi:hypothetical protein